MSTLSEPIEKPEHTTPLQRLAVRLVIYASPHEMTESEEWWVRSGWLPATWEYDE